MGIATAAMKRGIPILGICRGAQLMCVLSGGKLMQHIEDHSRGHDIVIKEDGSVIHATSSHHQMMLPPQEAEILAVATKPTKGMNQFNGYVNIQEVPEVVYFPNTNCLGVQPHPEWQSPGEPFVKYLGKIMKEKLQWVR